MKQGNDHRKANGRRLEGFGLATKVAQELRGMVLAQAFVITKSAGFQLNVNKLDGVPCNAHVRPDIGSVNVDVVGGIVSKSWAIEASR
jgi:hypothetical protein